MVARKPAKKAAAKKPTASRAEAKGGGDAAASYIAQQPPDKRVLLEKLRTLIAKGVPDARPSIKWGVPIYARNGKNICALASFKDNVAINFFAPPKVLVDPAKNLEGGGTRSRMLKVRTTGDIDSAAILRWLKAVVAANG
jgi:hypothetical protein